MCFKKMQDKTPKILNTKYHDEQFTSKIWRTLTSINDLEIRGQVINHEAVIMHTK